MTKHKYLYKSVLRLLLFIDFSKAFGSVDYNLVNLPSEELENLAIGNQFLS